MINLFGKQLISQIKNDFVRHKIDIAETSKIIIKYKKYSYRQIAENMKLSNYQISYALRNPKKTTSKKLINIYRTLIEMGDPKFQKQEKKYVLIPSWIYPKTGEPIFVNGSQIANLWGIDLNECVLWDFATKEQKETLIPLEVETK